MSSTYEPPAHVVHSIQHLPAPSPIEVRIHALRGALDVLKMRFEKGRVIDIEVADVYDIADSFEKWILDPDEDDEADG